MGFFDVVAPVFARFADRWSATEIDEIAGWLSPYVRPGGRLLDVGGGTGALAARLADALHCRVTVLDPTERMLRYVPERGDLESVVGVAEEMSFAEGTFDAVVSTDAFHHFPDQSRAAEEMARVVRPGGGILILEFDPRPLFMRVIVRGEKLLGEPGEFLTPDEMCAFFAARGIHGECAKVKAWSYRFLGEVR